MRELGHMVVELALGYTRRLAKRFPAPIRDMMNAHDQMILIVEDEPLIAMLLADLLGDAGFATAEAGNPAQAFAYVEEHGLPDLIISDQSMPGMTGTAMAAAIIAKYGPVPVVVATGHAFGPDMVYPILPKPYVAADVLAIVRSIIGGTESSADRRG